jgi:uncharacterized protein (DUF1778 family)
VRCTPGEAGQIREAARLERRTISGFILNAVMSRISAREVVSTGGVRIRLAGKQQKKKVKPKA